MVLAVKAKLTAVLVQLLSQADIDIDHAKEAWRMCALAGIDDGTRLFSQRLCFEFSEAAKDLMKTVAASQTFRSVVGSSASLGGVGQEQPFVAVIADVLGMAVEWFEGVMSEAWVDRTPLPNRSRTAVVVELHGYVRAESLQRRAQN